MRRRLFDRNSPHELKTPTQHVTSSRKRVCTMLPALTSGHIAGIIVTLCAVTLVGIYAGRMVKSALDFSVGGRRAGATVVAGTIMGTLVSGSSTIGTAQLAFQYGLCAWWFTLGAGLACAVLDLVWPAACTKAPWKRRPNIWSVSTGKGSARWQVFSLQQAFT